MNAKEIFEKLVARAMNWGLVTRSGKYSKPGELVGKLPAEEREELQNLQSKDTQDYDRTLMYIQGQYPENTTSVHKIFPHSKDEDDKR